MHATLQPSHFEFPTKINPKIEVVPIVYNIHNTQHERMYSIHNIQIDNRNKSNTKSKVNAHYSLLYKKISTSIYQLA